MAYDLYGNSWMRNSPLFINLQPFKLDLSPILETEKLRATIRMKAQAESDAQLQKIRDLDMPEFDNAISGDTPYYYNAALQARAGMEKRLAEGGNPKWVRRNDPEFLQYQRQYIQATSPEVKRKLAEQYDALKAFDEKNKENGSAGEYFMDGSGHIATNPLNPAIPITAGESSEIRKLQQFGLNSGFPVVAYEGATTATPELWRKGIKEGFENLGLTEWGGNASADNIKSLQALAAQENNKEAGALSLILSSSSGHSNSEQIQSAFNNIVNRPSSQQEKLSILQSYMKTKDFWDRREKEFLDKDGNLDTDEIWAAAVTPDKRWGSIGGKGGALSFVSSNVWDMGVKYLKSKSVTDLDLKTVQGGKANGRSSSDDDGKINFIQAMRAGLDMDWKPLQGPNGVVGQVSYPINTRGKKGDLVLKNAVGQAYQLELPPDISSKLWEALNVDPVASFDEKEAKSLSEVFPAAEIYLPHGGKLTNEQKRHVKLLGTEFNKAVALPMSFAVGAEKSPEELESKYHVRYKQEYVGSPYPGGHPVGIETKPELDASLETLKGKQDYYVVLKVYADDKAKRGSGGDAEDYRPVLKDVGSSGLLRVATNELALRPIGDDPDASEWSNQSVVSGLTNTGVKPVAGIMYMKIPKSFEFMQGLDVSTKAFDKNEQPADPVGSTSSADQTYNTVGGGALLP